MKFFKNKKHLLHTLYFILILLFFIYILYYFYKKNRVYKEFFNNFETRFEVIHMSGKEDRLQNIKTQEEKAKIKINLFEAVNGSQLDIPQLQKDGLVKKKWSTYRYNSAQTPEGKQKVINGEIGCYMSHMNLLKKISESEYDGWTIVFEDDFLLESNFKEELDKILENIKDNQEIDIIYLGSLNQDDCKNGVYKDNLCHPVNPWGTQGYMVNKRSASKIYNLIKFIDREIDIKYRDLMNKKKINGLIVVPTLVKQNYEGNPSVINGD